LLAWITTLETTLKLLAGIASLGTFTFATASVPLAQKRPTGRTTSAASRLLRTPFLVSASLVYLVAAYLLWIPLPLQFNRPVELIFILVRALVYFPSLALYICVRLSLGENFNGSRGFGVRLLQSHRLVTDGPFACLRHSMDLAIIPACWSGMMIYLTWTMLILAVLMLGLVIRTCREQQTLEVEFGVA
jgi:isoprenylcysteine carboxyl methyltransferase (ICMT) family protein YpbQ